MKDVQELVNAVTTFLHHWDSNHVLKTATAAEVMRKTLGELNLSTLKWNEIALKEWLDKTDWVQQTVQAGELGMHRADVLHDRIKKEASLNRKAYTAGIEDGKRQNEDWKRAVIDQLVCPGPRK